LVEYHGAPCKLDTDKLTQADLRLTAGCFKTAIHLPSYTHACAIQATANTEQ
jgi:hypothetical protein